MSTFNQTRKEEMIRTIEFCRYIQSDLDYLYSLTLHNYNPAANRL